MKQNKSKGMVMLSLLLSLVMAAIIVAILITMYAGSHKNKGKGETSTQTPIERTKTVACLAQRRNLEVAIKMYVVENSNFPTSLDDLKDLASENFRCPETGNPYKYDPATGRVTCPDHP